MALAILSAEIRQERDTVNARQRARQLARLLGFDAQDQTRISTAVSEIARNAYNYAKGGRIEFLIEGQTRPQLFVIKVVDRGAGISNLSTILEGRYESQTGMGLGIIGAKRLMDRFDISTFPGAGTTVEMTKLIPKNSPLIAKEDVGRITNELAGLRPHDPIQELQFQNHELLKALEEIRTRQSELAMLNRELEDTNRGVVALYAELDEKADHLRRADELKSKFLSNMSHEFRSPLNSILALSGLLHDRSDGPLTVDQEQQVGYIRKAAEDLLELVNDLLDMAKVEAGKLEARPIEFEVANLFAALRGMLKPLLLNQSVDLVFEDATHLPGLFTDEGKVSQILRNFISNALKFTEKGEVRISAQLLGENEIAMSVSDTGIGIAPKDRDLIFHDFVQLDHPIQRKVKGTGLGLPLSKKLATFLGGSVEVQSELGIGSTFTVRLPCRYPGMDREQIAAPPVELSSDSPGRPVLFVDDNPETIMAYKSYLRNSGFQAFSASTTREAEQLLDKIEPCAIVLDIILRSEDTWAFMATLKKDDRTRDIPLMVVSTTEDQEKGFRLGADAYIVKPVERGVLLRELNALTAVPASTRVLIIDDLELDRYLLKQHFKKLPLSILEESSGADGIEKARESLPDIIFLDLTMPDMTGFEVVDELKRKSETRRIPVVIVTSRALSQPERNRLVPECFAIVDKASLSNSSGAEAIRHILEEAIR
jgi:signal transduction histidine kinase/DNA-binding response OmpR family regulator